MYDLIIRDATIVDAGARLVADIAVEDGKIAYVGGNAAGGARVEVPAIGRFVMPGAIDANVHFREPGFTHKEDWASGSRAAVARGVTTVLDMPDTDPTTTGAAAVRHKLALAAERSVANYGVWVGLTPDNLDDASGLWDEGLVCGLKLCVGSPEDTLGYDYELLEAAFAGARGLLGVRAEDPRTLARAARKWSEVTDPVHNDVRPPKAAGEAMKRIIQLVRQNPRPVHICSLSTAAELTMLDPLRGDLPITTEVCPQHLYLSVDANADLGNLIKVDPPVRGELDRRALWAAVKRGRIDCFASDHAPHTLDEKGTGYWKAPSGVPGVETVWPLLMTAVKHGRVGLERVVHMLTEGPSQVFGLAGKGRIEEGADADLVLFAEGETTKLHKKDLLCKAKWSPYVGREVGVPPELVLVSGRIAARNGVLADDLQPGQPVRYAERG